MNRYYLYIIIPSIIGIIGWIYLGYHNYYNRYLSNGFAITLLICLIIILIFGSDEK